MDNWWISVWAIFIYVVIYALVILAWAEIFLKAGYNRWLCLVMIVPAINIFIFFWFSYSKWPIHEFISRDWRKKMLVEQKRQIEQELKSLSASNIGNQNKVLSQNDRLHELRQQYKEVKKFSEDNFLKAFKYPDNSPERISYFKLGTEYKQKAEVLEKELFNIQGN